MTFVVVGGDAAGMSAASKAKRENPDLEVVVFEKGQWVSYGACGLPYYVKGEIQSLESLVSVTPEEFTRSGTSTSGPATRSSASTATPGRSPPKARTAR